MKIPKCMTCNNFYDSDDENEDFKCKAYPDGIPDDVLWEDDDEECNNGVKYEE
ncbi:MAG: hypothetical protein PHY47_27745 [Lachnospiraceae bacterium]|nr:hypothetical protein [Lachnospiraceae bacterium]